MRIVICFLVILIAAIAPAQVTLQVPSSFATIQSAINAAQPGDIVQIAAGTYLETIDFNGKLITVRGAGMNLTILDGQHSGPVVTVLSGEPVGAALEDLTVRNATAAMVQTSFGDPGHLIGGGIAVALSHGTGFGFPSLAIRRCRIETCWGGGIGVEGADEILIEDSVVTNNLGNPPPALPTTGSPGVSIKGVLNGVTIQRCEISNNQGSVGGLDGGTDNIQVLDCDIVGNTGSSHGGARFTFGTSGSLIERCRIQGNSTTAGALSGAGLFVLQPGAPIRNCIIADNTGVFTGGGIALSGGGFGPNYSPFRIENCTIVNNGPTAEGDGLYAFGGPVDIVNCIFRGAPGESQIVADSTVSVVNIDHCVFPATGGAFVVAPIFTTVNLINTIDVDPLFVDPANGDYHLSVASPCVNAGTSAIALSATDIDGDPRDLFGAPDIGADEVNDVVVHPSAAGRVGENAGGPFAILEVNGSTGGVDRRVTAPIGSAATVAMLQPPNLTGPAKFAIFGILDEPRIDFVVSVPLGIGDMAFAPCPLLPFLWPYVFTFTNNFGPDLCGELVASSPTPWTSPPGPTIPFPLTIGLQGVIEEAPGVYVPTNLVIYEVQ